MGNEIVKYSNDMNALRFTDFTQTDYDFLMAICNRMKGLGEKEITIEYQTIMELINWNRKNTIAMFQNELFQMSQKLSKVSGAIKDNNGFKVFNLFSTFECNYKKRELTISINPKFVYILNDINKNFTRIELKEFVGIDSRYAKALYMQIKQRYKQNGHFWQIDIDDLKNLLDIPNSYLPREITRAIINPSVEIIKTCKGLSDLKVEILYKSYKGKPIKGYRFTWTPSGQIKGQKSIYDYAGVVPEEKQPKITRKKKNSFNNFEQNTYDFAELEEKLLDN
jgi:plasmid replication initiation protein